MKVRIVLLGSESVKTYIVKDESSTFLSNKCKKTIDTKSNDNATIKWTLFSRVTSTFQIDKSAFNILAWSISLWSSWFSTFKNIGGT